jgi:uncharacterized membrane protein
MALRARLECEQGSVLITGLLLSIALIMVIGFAVDVGHAFLVKRQLASIADDAALSGSQAIDVPCCRSPKESTQARSYSSASASSPDCCASVSPRPPCSAWAT